MVILTKITGFVYEDAKFFQFYITFVVLVKTAGNFPASDGIRRMEVDGYFSYPRQ